MVHIYDTVVIFNLAIDEDTRKELIRLCSLMIENNSAETIKINEWGEKTLAYPTGKHKKGYYVTYLFRGTEEDAEHIGKRLEAFPAVLKHIIVENDLYMNNAEDGMNNAVEEITAMEILFE